MASFLLIGGVRSGKSSWAVNYAQHYKSKLYIATAEPCDADMRMRIQKHQQERGEGWTTIEAGTNILYALEQAGDPYDCIVIDCLTIWTARIMEESKSHDDLIMKWVEPMVERIKAISKDVIIVTNEVGMGVHPAYESGRQYRDLLGLVNQRFAQACGNVLLFVAGIPTAIKGHLPE